MNERNKTAGKRAQRPPFFPPFLLTHPSQSVARNRFVVIICVIELLLVIFFSIEEDLRFNPLLDINMFLLCVCFFLFQSEIDQNVMMMMMESTRRRRRKEEKKRGGKETSRLIRFHPVLCLPAMLDVVERVIHRYHMSALFFLLDEHDLPLYSSFFSILLDFFCVYVLRRRVNV